MSRLTTAFVTRTMRSFGYRVDAGPDVSISGGAADSRKVQPGNLFTAFPGENTDGNLYVADALRAGAIAAICERAPEGLWPAETIVVAPDATRAVGELAQAWRRECATPVVGITGTVGKTTAKELIAATLAAKFRVHKSEGNLNSREGLPLALLTLQPEDEVSVLEMGMDSKGEIARLCEIAEPRIGVVLNIGLTHVEKLGTAEAIAEEKMTLPKRLPVDGTAVLNMDDRRIALGRGELACSVIGFGKDQAAELRLVRTEDRGLDGVDSTVRWQGDEVVVRSPLPGLHVVPAALAAASVALAMGMTLPEAAAAVGAAAIDGRLRQVRTGYGATILDDRYNASPVSVAGALELLGRLPGRHIALLGKMAELGSYAEEEHRRIGRVAAANVQVLATFGELGRVMAAAAREAGLEDAQWFESKEAAAESLARHLREGDTVLVKGSRSEALETVLPVLERAR